MGRDWSAHPGSGAAALRAAQQLAVYAALPLASGLSAASRAAKTSSTRWASDARNLFFSVRQRCAHTAASSPFWRSLSSVSNRSRNSIDCSGDSIGLLALVSALRSRSGATFCGPFGWPSFHWPLPPFGCCGSPFCRGGTARSGASTSSSPAMPTSVNKA